MPPNHPAVSAILEAISDTIPLDDKAREKRQAVREWLALVPEADREMVILVAQGMTLDAPDDHILTLESGHSMTFGTAREEFETWRDVFAINLLQIGAITEADLDAQDEPPAA